MENSPQQTSSDGVDLHYGHPRMSLADRAKIFMPFDPLKGFREALAQQERLTAGSFEKPVENPDDLTA